MARVKLVQLILIIHTLNQPTYFRVRVVDDKIYPPGDEQWDSEVYVVTYPKGLLHSMNLLPILNIFLLNC